MEIQHYTHTIFKGVQHIIESAKQKAAVFLNAETTLLYWQVGNYINEQLIHKERADYGAKIIATLSQQLTMQYGKGYTYTALTRMCRVAIFVDAEIIVTLSQRLSWSHLIELAAIEDSIKRNFFTQLCLYEGWSIRTLRGKIDSMLFERTAIASQSEKTIKDALQNLSKEKMLTPELVFKNSYVLNFLNLPSTYSEEELETALVNNLKEFILELGSGFAFMERQKRISVDAIDYHLDLLFYHRKLKRLVAPSRRQPADRPIGRLAAVGEREGDFPTPHGRGDEFHHGSPGIDPRSLPPKPRDIYVPDLHIDSIKVKTRDFR